MRELQEVLVAPLLVVVVVGQLVQDRVALQLAY